MDNKSKSISVWGASPAGNIFAKDILPGTKKYFDITIKARNEYEIPWLFEVINFSYFRNKKVLEIGCGAGYDAYEFYRNEANYSGIDISFENIQRTKKHLDYYGYKPNVNEGDAEALPFKGEIFEIVFSNGVLHHTPDIEKSFQEAFRVLRKGGEFWVIVYHKNSLFYWVTLGIFDHILGRGFLKRSFRERLSMIEFTTSNELPIVNVYSRKVLKKMLKQNGFAVESIWVRKLVKEDLPPIPLFNRLWNFIPQSFLDIVGKVFGWYVIAKARKV